MRCAPLARRARGFVTRRAQAARRFTPDVSRRGPGLSRHRAFLRQHHVRARSTFRASRAWTTATSPAVAVSLTSTGAWAAQPLCVMQATCAFGSATSTVQAACRTLTAAEVAPMCCATPAPRARGILTPRAQAAWRFMPAASRRGQDLRHQGDASRRFSRRSHEHRGARPLLSTRSALPRPSEYLLSAQYAPAPDSKSRESALLARSLAALPLGAPQ